MLSGRGCILLHRVVHILLILQNTGVAGSVSQRTDYSLSIGTQGYVQ